MKILLSILLLFGSLVSHGQDLGDPGFFAGLNVAAAGGGSSTLRTDLVAWWSMDEASGTRADSHGTAQDLTENGTGGIGSATGKQGNAADLEDGDSDYFDTADHADFVQGGTSPTSINFWVKPETLVAADSFFSQGSEIIIRDGPGTADVEFVLNTFTTNDRTDTADSMLADGVWAMVTCTYDGTDMKIFVDGVLRSIITPTGTWLDSASNILVGRFGSAYMDGLLDEFAVWNKALSDGSVTTVGNTAGGEVAELFNGGDGIGYGSTAP